MGGTYGLGESKDLIQVFKEQQRRRVVQGEMVVCLFFAASDFVSNHVHQQIHKEGIFVLRRLFATEPPHLGVASLHQPTFETDRMLEERAFVDQVRRQRFDQRVERRDLVRTKQSQQPQSQQRLVVLRSREGAVVKRREQ